MQIAGVSFREWYNPPGVPRPARLDLRYDEHIVTVACEWHVGRGGSGSFDAAPDCSTRSYWSDGLQTRLWGGGVRSVYGAGRRPRGALLYYRSGSRGRERGGHDRGPGS